MKKKQYLVCSLIALSISVFCMGKSLNAQTILLSENFESYTAGQSLNGLNPGDGNSENWIVGNAGTGKGATVAAGSSTGGSGDNENIGSYFYDSTATGTFPTLRRNFDIQSNPIQVSFKLRMDNSNSVSQQLVLAQVTGGPIQTAVRFRFSASTFSAYGATTTPGGSQSIQSIISDVQIGDWYQVDIFVNQTDQTFQISVMNLDDTSAGQSGISSLMYFWHDTTVINRFSFEQASVGQTGMSVDDIMITAAIPEPVTTGLLGLAGTVLLMGMRRNRRG